MATLKVLLKNRMVLVSLGILLLALIIWFAGPYFAFADHKPLESTVGRLLAILLMVTLFAGYVLYRQVRNAQKNQQLAEEVAKQGGGTPDNGEAAQLTKRFDEALQALKARRGGRGLYDLPWYVIIGPPGAGKTTLARPLAKALGFALLSKDDIKEPLYDALAGERFHCRSVRFGGLRPGHSARPDS